MPKSPQVIPQSHNSLDLIPILNDPKFTSSSDIYSIPLAVDDSLMGTYREEYISMNVEEMDLEGINLQSIIDAYQK